MNVEQPDNRTHAARDHLLASLNALASDDCVKTSRRLWLAAREAVAVVARQHDWPASSDEEIKEAICRLDAEYGNADYRFLDKDEIIWFQPIVHDFVDRLLAPRDSRKANWDADPIGARR